MHYYKRNIGDYAKKAGRLTMLQHGAYTLLMDAVYDREVFPSIDEAIEWVWASNQDEIDAVTFVLTRFFTLEDGAYIQKRMQQELQEYTGVCITNSINGKKGGRPKGSKNNPNKTESVNNKTHSVNIKSELKRSESELKPNHKPLTTNHKPFKDFWSIYPNKKGKAEAEKKWNRMKVGNELFSLIEKHLSTAYQQTEKQYIPHGSTYLNQQRWLDEIEEDTIPYQQLVSMYNKLCPNLKECKGLTDTRKELIRVFWNAEESHKNSEFMQSYLSTANQDSYLTGNNQKGYKANFDYIFKHDTVINLMENKL